jgi:hypothetical protein
MRESADTLVFRSLDLQNGLPAVVGLLNDVERADLTGEQVAEATLREQLTWSRQDPVSNNWVVTTPDGDSLSPGTAKPTLPFRSCSRPSIGCCHNSRKRSSSKPGEKVPTRLHAIGLLDSP